MRSFFTARRMTGLLYLGLALTGMLSFLLIRSQILRRRRRRRDARQPRRATRSSRAGASPSSSGSSSSRQCSRCRSSRCSAPSGPSRPSRSRRSASSTPSRSCSRRCCGAWRSRSPSTPAQRLRRAADAAATALLLFDLHDAAWDAGNLFFGLWLIPMGLAVLASGWVRVLGWALIGGGVRLRSQRVRADPRPGARCSRRAARRPGHRRRTVDHRVPAVHAHAYRGARPPRAGHRLTPASPSRRCPPLLGPLSREICCVHADPSSFVTCVRVFTQLAYTGDGRTARGNQSEVLRPDERVVGPAAPARGAVQNRAELTSLAPGVPGGTVWGSWDVTGHLLDGVNRDGDDDSGRASHMPH